MVLIERPQIMTFEQSEKPGLKRKLAHEFRELVWIFLYLALFLLHHGNVKRGLIGAAMLSPSMSVLTLAFAAPAKRVSASRSSLS
jgi:hypothetical protein